MYVRKILVGCLVLLWLVGPLVWPRLMDTCVRLDAWRESGSKTANYFVAGLLNQPRGAFGFIARDAALQGEDIIFATYLNTGVDYDWLFDEIERDVDVHGYSRVRIFGISVGCAVTHAANLSWLSGCELYCYEINPCWTSKFLNAELRGVWPQVGMPVLMVVDFLLGPLKFAPVIPQSGEWFSVHLLYNQLQRIYTEKTLGYDGKRHTQLVVLSEDDEFLDNWEIAKYYGDTKTLELNRVAHARTIDQAEEYAKVVRPELAKE